MVVGPREGLVIALFFTQNFLKHGGLHTVHVLIKLSFCKI
jgi:hypothetical protein